MYCQLYSYKVSNICIILSHTRFFSYTSVESVRKQSQLLTPLLRSVILMFAENRNFLTVLMKMILFTVGNSEIPTLIFRQTSDTLSISLCRFL